MTYVLKKDKIKSLKLQKELYPLHKILQKVESNVTNSHNLTGYDTVAKVGTKAKMLAGLTTQCGELIENFGKEGLERRRT